MRSNVLKRRMEIIGASIMNGFGDLGSDMGCQPTYKVCPYLAVAMTAPSSHVHVQLLELSAL